MERTFKPSKPRSAAHIRPIPPANEPNRRTQPQNPRWRYPRHSAPTRAKIAHAQKFEPFQKVKVAKQNFSNYPHHNI